MSNAARTAICMNCNAYWRIWTSELLLLKPHTLPMLGFMPQCPQNKIERPDQLVLNGLRRGDGYVIEDAVDNSELFRLLTTSPMYPLLAIDMLTVPCRVQSTPSGEK